MTIESCYLIRVQLDGTRFGSFSGVALYGLDVDQGSCRNLNLWEEPVPAGNHQWTAQEDENSRHSQMRSVGQLSPPFGEGRQQRPGESDEWPGRR